VGNPASPPGERGFPSRCGQLREPPGEWSCPSPLWATSWAGTQSPSTGRPWGASPTSSPQRALPSRAVRAGRPHSERPGTALRSPDGGRHRRHLHSAHRAVRAGRAHSQRPGTARCAHRMGGVTDVISTARTAEPSGAGGTPTLRAAGDRAALTGWGASPTSSPQRAFTPDSEQAGAGGTPTLRAAGDRDVIG